MLSKREREFLQDYIDLNNPPYSDAAKKENEFREKWSYEYEKVMWHRIKKKYMQLIHDLWLLNASLSIYVRRELAYLYLVGDQRPPEKEAQGICDLVDLLHNEECGIEFSSFLKENYQIALDRLNDDNDEIISSDQMKEFLSGEQDKSQ